MSLPSEILLSSEILLAMVFCFQIDTNCIKRAKNKTQCADTKSASMAGETANGKIIIMTFDLSPNKDRKSRTEHVWCRGKRLAL